MNQKTVYYLKAKKVQKFHFFFTDSISDQSLMATNCSIIVNDVTYLKKLEVEIIK